MFYTIRRFILNIPWNLKLVKFFFQRGKRGWADCDVWNMSYYIAEVIPGMLKQLKNNLNGHPSDITFEKWQSFLDEMIEGWEAALRVCDDEYYKQVSGDSIEAISKATRKEIKEWQRLNVADQKLFKSKMKVFADWYFNLWD